jgi:hypothetical protein
VKLIADRAKLDSFAAAQPVRRSGRSVQRARSREVIGLKPCARGGG